MGKTLKKILSGTVLVVSLFSATAFAYTKGTGYFTYGSFTASGSLTTYFYAGSPDVGAARTDRISACNSSYKVVAYLETQDSYGGPATSSLLDSGYTWARSDISRSGVWSFNSTHAISSSGNIYAYKTYRQLSDW